jgi:NAD(P)-dependent dehydrogenase (short-subunit alcohol dehydrogenase family)
MKNIIITGSTGQLGSAFVKHLAKKQNVKIFACDIKSPDEEIPKNVEFVNLDITDESQVVSIFNSLNKIDILINNAGIGVFTPFEERTVDEFTNVFDVNLKGTFLMCREAIKKMRKASMGKIINIGSIYGVVSSNPNIYGLSGRNNSEIYSASKAGVIMMTKYLAAHYADLNIQINAISPGGIYRNQSDDFLSNYSSITPSKTLAKDIDFLPAIDFLISDKNNYINGQNIIVDGGFTSW